MYKRLHHWTVPAGGGKRASRSFTLLFPQRTYSTGIIIGPDLLCLATTPTKARLHWS
jgi:hypothetical protein